MGEIYKLLTSNFLKISRTENHKNRRILDGVILKDQKATDRFFGDTVYDVRCNQSVSEQSITTTGLRGRVLTIKKQSPTAENRQGLRPKSVPWVQRRFRSA